MNNIYIQGGIKLKKIFFILFFLFSLEVVFSQGSNYSDHSGYKNSSNNSAISLYDQGLEFFYDQSWWDASEKFQEALQKNPAYADAWYMLAKCSYEMDQFDLSIKYVDNAIKYSGNKVEYRNLKAFNYISLGKFKEAEEIFKNILQNYPNNIESRFGLAELDLYYGRLSSAANLYTDALKREPKNRKALLSLAVVCTEQGKTSLAQNYINKALQSYSNNCEVYYVAAYLAVLNGDLKDAERKCLMAVQANGNYDEAYGLLQTIYYAQKRYQDVIDISDFRINRNYNASQSWYLKGLSLEKLNRIEESLSVWEKGLEINPTDEIMRAAFDLSILKNTDIEDSRRKKWALYHVRKGQDYQKRYLGTQVRYEYQMALKINPNNTTARTAFSNILYNDGFNENYLEQIRFVKENLPVPKFDSSKKLSDTEELKKINYIRLSDTIEGFESLMYNTLANKWDINPFYLDKTRWNIGIFYSEKIEPHYHSDISRIACEYLNVMFKGFASTNVNLYSRKVQGYADAYKIAHDKKLDYFIILTGDETARDVKIDAIMYSGRTGTKTQSFSVYKTGNDKFTGSLLKLRKDILSVLPVKARILNRSLNDILVDIGKTEGLVKGAVFKVIQKGSIKTSDTGIGLIYSDDAVLGTVTLTKVSEEISEGVLSDTGFYDRVNADDELILVKLSDDKSTTEASQAALDTAPQGQEDILDKKTSPLKGADLEINRIPSLLKMIKEIN